MVPSCCGIGLTTMELELGGRDLVEVWGMDAWMISMSTSMKCLSHKVIDLMEITNRPKKQFANLAPPSGHVSGFTVGGGAQ